ncbi:MAG TPA: helix-turn-helix domain-containing protein [Candidatus Acidoferrum sp.]|nr:helix-turn-helix domain-containing protein [Candidatus Acidoferrum sp.]
MGRRASGPERNGAATLTAQDWTEAALRLIAERGLNGLTIDALAKRLRATKGSFYWHFRGRADLLSSALTRWETRSTAETIKTLRAIGDPRRRLQTILSAASQAPPARSLYVALSEATYDKTVRAALHRVGKTRIEELQCAYRDLGLPAGKAKSMSVLVYAAYRGLLQLAREAPDALPEDWAEYGDEVKRVMIPGMKPRRRVKR